MMPEKLKALLDGSDEDLFMKGACHVFARELASVFSESQYKIWCMEEESWMYHPENGKSKFGLRHLVHVYAKANERLVDVRGVHDEQAYCEEYKARELRYSGLSTFYAETFVRKSPIEELFTATLDEPETGPMNKHRLYLEETFVELATKRARSLIDRDRDRFRLLPRADQAIARVDLESS